MSSRWTKLHAVVGALCFFAAASTLSAADPDRTFLYSGEIRKFVPERAPTPPLYISGGTLIDGSGAAPRPNPGLLIRAGVFESIGATAVPADAARIDATGKWILPGLFDVHAHITFYFPAGFNVEDDSLNAIRSERFLEAYQRVGITTVRDVASRNHVGYSLKRAQRLGLAGGARLYVSGPGITVTGGHATEFEPYEPAVYAVEGDGPWELRKRVREAAKLGADLIKTFPPLTEDELRAIVDEAHSWQLRVTSHVGGFQDSGRLSARRAVDAGVDSLEHLYPYGDERTTPAVLADIARKHIYVVPTLRFHLNELARATGARSLWLELQIHHDRQTMMALFHDMQKAGIKFAVGTDSNAPDMPTIGAVYREELAALANGGLSAMQVIQAATLNGAATMGLQNEAGTIVAGKWGDLVILAANPLENLDSMVAPDHVIQAGATVYRR
ncbi:MAG: amidohydrolase family protein [Gammaproteobacteria bacterium]